MAISAACIPMLIRLSRHVRGLNKVTRNSTSYSEADRSKHQPTYGRFKVLKTQGVNAPEEHGPLNDLKLARNVVQSVEENV